MSDAALMKATRWFERTPGPSFDAGENAIVDETGHARSPGQRLASIAARMSLTL
jgi:hypothetical protein